MMGSDIHLRKVTVTMSAGLSLGMGEAEASGLDPVLLTGKAEW